jgi:hypothetical protein
MFHFLALLITCSLSLKLGFLSKREVDTQIQDVVVRPPEDTATMFAFVKQGFYHRTLAYTNLEKDRSLATQAMPCFAVKKKK